MTPRRPEPYRCSECGYVRGRRIPVAKVVPAGSEARMCAEMVREFIRQHNDDLRTSMDNALEELAQAMEQSCIDSGG